MEIILVSGKNIIYHISIDISSLIFRYTLPYISGLYNIKLTMSGMDYSAIVLLQTYAEGIGACTCKIVNEAKFQQSANVSLEITGRDLLFTVTNATSEANFMLIKMC